MLQCCGVGGGASTAPPQLQGTGSALGATTSTRTIIMQDAVLESILEQMRETEARRAELERQHAEAQNQLREKIAGRYQGPESVEALQSKIRELEKKTELQMVRHEELSLELTSLRRARSRGPVVGGHVTNVPSATWPPADSEIDRIIAKIEQNNSAGRILHELDHARGGITTQQPSATQGILRSSSENLPNLGHQHPPHPHALSLGMPSQMGHYAGSPMPLTPMMPGCPPLTPNGPPYHYSEPIPPAPSLSSSQSQPVFQQKLQQYQQQQHEISSSHSQSALPSQQKQQQQTHTSHFSNQYQESYPHTQTYQQPLQQQQPPQQQQQQPQQHPASTTYLTSASQSVIPHYTQPAQTAQNYQLNGSQQATTYPNLSMASHPNGTYSTGATSYNTQLPHHNYTVPQTNITQTTLSSLPLYSSTSYHSTLGGLTSVPQSVLPYSTGQSTFATSGSTYSTTVGTNAYGTSGSGTSSGGLLQAIGDPLQAMQQLSAQSQVNQLQQQAIIHQIQQSLRASSPTAPGTATGTATGHHFLGPRQMPKIPTSILTNPLDRLTNPEDIISEGQVDMLDVPGKGRCYVYIARFSYEPFQHSPNANPEAELPVQGGDYLLVWGQPDEDGFLDAETLDGRRGLVPANFVQKLVGDDLLDFHQAVLGLRDVDDSVSTNIPQCYLQDIDLELAALEEGNRNRQAELSAYAELDNIAEEDEQEPPVPAPQHLTLERQLNKSVLIGWTAPDNTHQLESYHVYVDGVLKVTVKATERTRALVEGVDSTRPHRISVRSVTHSRRTSRDAACTMVIGKDVALGPTAVKASNVTATSAVISWLPSNSNHQHVVCVNNVEVRTVKPGVYRHTITGLAPSTIYRVTVKAKNLRATHFEDQNAQAANNLACHVHFKTLPKGLPDPPVDIQVEAGPRDGTLLVTWQPVALNGSAVTGYAVYADGKKVTDVDSPTGDHALVDIHKLMGLNPKHITVRTKSRESQSGDSCATAIPCSVLRGGAAGHMPQTGPQDMVQRQQPQPPGMLPQGQDDPNRHRVAAAGGQRYPNAPVPSHMRRHMSNRVDAHGQVIIETDENLSDKEIYPGQSIAQMGIPEITKDSASEANYSEEDDPARRRGMPPQHHSPHHRYPQGPLGAHKSPNMGGPSRSQDPYYDQTGAQRGRGPVYRGGRLPMNTGMAMSAQQMNKRPRWFVALFDYDPTTMSPNPDACDEELPFSEGDTIKVYGEKDADGFYWGECRGRRGFVPYNMVEELKDPPGQTQPGRRGPGQSERWGDIYASMPMKKMIALYDYDPHELSPNVDSQVELTFQTGNEIYVYGEMDDDGFYMGELNGQRGLVPSNFLTEAPGQNQGQPPQGGRRPGGQSQGPGARGPPPPPREPPPAGHRRGKDACIVPVSVPVCHLDSRQLQQPPPSLMNNQQHQLQHQNNPPHLAYQQANHHSYTTVTTSNQHGPSHLPPGGGVMGAHQQGPVPPHLQQQGKGRGGVVNRGVGNLPGMHHQQPDYQGQQQPNQPYQQQQPNQPYQQQQQNQGYQQQPQQPFQQQQPQPGTSFSQPNQLGMQGPQGASKPMRGIPTVLPTAQSKTQPNPAQGQQQQQQPQQQSTGPNLMQKFTEMAGASAGGDILSKGKELIFMKFGLGK